MTEESKPITMEEMEENSTPIDELVESAETVFPPQNTVEAVAHKVNALEAALLPKITSLQQSVDQLANTVIILQQPAETLAKTDFTFGGFTFTLRTLPKQDAFHGGVNLVGRAGVLLVANDGQRSYTIAKMEWDHQRESFVLYTGKGVN